MKSSNRREMKSKKPLLSLKISKVSQERKVAPMGTVVGCHATTGTGACGGNATVLAC